jgi:hypothetical protein
MDRRGVVLKLIRKLTFFKAICNGYNFMAKRLQLYDKRQAAPLGVGCDVKFAGGVTLLSDKSEVQRRKGLEPFRRQCLAFP